MTKKLKHPTSEQLAAVRDYAHRNGKDWKRKLAEDWMRAGSYGMTHDEWAPLQQLRNTLGPKWLATFELEKA